MKILISQIYIRPGISYPFSYKFQRLVSATLSSLVRPSETFLKKYSPDYKLIFNVSAKVDIQTTEIKGPTVYKKDKDVEFTLFLPHKGPGASEHVDYTVVLKLLFQGIITVLQRYDIDASPVQERIDSLIHEICSNPEMFET